MNVLKITTTPIRLSMTSQRARLDSEIPDPEIGIIQNREETGAGGLCQRKGFAEREGDLSRRGVCD